MDLQPKSDSYGVGDMSWLRSSHAVDTGVSCTLPTADLVEAVHFPTGHLKGGTLLAKYTSGANDGLYGVHVPDATDGRETAVGVLLEDVPVRKDSAGALLSTKIVGSVLLLPILVVVSKMPAITLANDSSHTVVAADLPSQVTAV